MEKLKNIRLYKCEKEEKICGVCAGLAKVFGIDVTLVRIAWILIACFWGSGILAYILLAFALPDEEEVIQKSTPNTDGANINTEKKDLL